jgi:hypothetical protein
MQNRTPSQPPRHEQDRHTTTTRHSQGKQTREDQQKGTSQDRQRSGMAKGHPDRGSSTDHE